MWYTVEKEIICHEVVPVYIYVYQNASVDNCHLC